MKPSVDRKQVRELAGLSFVERAENVVLPATRCSSSPYLLGAQGFLGAHGLAAGEPIGVGLTFMIVPLPNT